MRTGTSTEWLNNWVAMSSWMYPMSFLVKKNGDVLKTLNTNGNP
jgi:hypothetical protein